MNVETWLAPFAPEERVQPRRLDDAELLAFAGFLAPDTGAQPGVKPRKLSPAQRARHSLYRLVETNAIACERGAAPMRRDGRRGAARIFVTLQAIAEWRASRFIPVTEIGPPANTPLPTRGDRGRAR